MTTWFVLCHHLKTGKKQASTTPKSSEVSIISYNTTSIDSNRYKYTLWLESQSVSTCPDVFFHTFIPKRTTGGSGIGWVSARKVGCTSSLIKDHPHHFPQFLMRKKNIDYLIEKKHVLALNHEILQVFNRNICVEQCHKPPLCHKFMKFMVSICFNPIKMNAKSLGWRDGGSPRLDQETRARRSCRMAK